MVVPRDFLEAGDLKTLPQFDGPDKVAGVEQTFVRAGVEPGVAAPEPLDMERARFEIS